MSVLSLIVVPMHSRQFTDVPPILSLAIGDRHLCRETLDKRLIQGNCLWPCTLSGLLLLFEHVGPDSIAYSNEQIYLVIRA
jgi:hypothetical protein